MNLPIAITHICGHSGARTFPGSANHRELLTRAFSERPCRDCVPAGGHVSRALLRAIERAEVESRWLPPLSGLPEETVGATALRACFLLALERYRVRGIFGPPGQELDALLRVALQGDDHEFKLRFAVVGDWLHENGLEADGRSDSLDLFAWHLGRIRLSDRTSATAWLTPFRDSFSGPLDDAMTFFARLDRSKRKRPAKK